MAEDENTVQITADGAPLRLDKFISTHRPEISRSQAQRLIAGDRVTVNGSPGKASLLVEAGDNVVINIPATPGTDLLPQAIPVTIVYEDDDVIVVDKPPGLTVHPAPGHPDGTLANAILSHLPQLDTGDRQRPGIVHRLDRDTSGLIIIAKHERAHQDLSAQFKARTVKKIYITLVHGRVRPPEGAIDAPIGRDRSHRERMAIVDSEHGRDAWTNYRVIRYVNNLSLLEVRPETGRTHQIRVHLAAIGHPVIGDKVYGVKSPYLDRQFLHASHIGFQLPSSGRHVEFGSELPPDLVRALEDITRSSPTPRTTGF